MNELIPFFHSIVTFGQVELPISKETLFTGLVAHLLVIGGAFLKLQAQVRELIVWKNERTKPIEDYYQEQKKNAERLVALEIRHDNLAQKIDDHHKDVMSAIHDLRSKIS